MSLTMNIRRNRQAAMARSRLERAQEAYLQAMTACRGGVGAASERIAPAAERTRDMAAERLLLARGWSAPRLETAAHYVEADLAPRVSSFLADMAHRVEPEQPQRSRKAIVGMAVAVAAIGVAGVMATRRNNALSWTEMESEVERKAREAADTTGSDDKVRST